MPTRAQLALVHIAKKELRLTDEIYRDILYCMFQKESSAQLTFDELAKLINHFKWLGWRPQEHRATGGKLSGARLADDSQATPAQQNKILAMWMSGAEIHRKDREGLRHFLRSRFHVADLHYVKARQVTAILAAIRRMSLQKNRSAVQSHTPHTQIN